MPSPRKIASQPGPGSTSIAMPASTTVTPTTVTTTL
jgi:hypothetical protein